MMIMLLTKKLREMKSSGAPIALRLSGSFNVIIGRPGVYLTLAAVIGCCLRKQAR
jgi:hypothetical protein